MTQRMVAGLNTRIQNDGQPSEEVATLIVNLVTLKLKAKRLTDVPFNIGSNYDSQSLLSELRRQPTGWGGVYSDILSSVPPLVAPSDPASGGSSHEEL